jgi:hypothetical protein
VLGHINDFSHCSLKWCATYINPYDGDRHSPKHWTLTIFPLLIKREDFIAYYITLLIYSQRNYYLVEGLVEQMFELYRCLDMHLALFLGTDTFRYSTSIFLSQMLVKLIT